MRRGDQSRRAMSQTAKGGWLLPNEMRLSCAAMLWCSQMEFYYDGRRQLQPLVRLPGSRFQPQPAVH